VVWHFESEDNADWVKQHVTVESDGTRQRRLLRKAWWAGVEEERRL